MFFTYKEEGSVAPVAVILHKQIVNDKEKTVRKYVYYTEKKGPDSFKQLQLTDEEKEERTIVPIPFREPKKKNRRVMTNIVGSSGSGKSYLLGNILREYTKIHKDRKDRYLFTAALEDDPAFAGLKIKRVDLAWAVQNAELEDIKQSICIFDDFQYMPSKEIEEWVIHFMRAALERSRKLEADLFTIVHDTKQAWITKLLNLECGNYILFPVSNRNASIGILKTCMGFNKKQMEYFKLINNGMYSYVMVNKNPPYLISQDRIIFYDEI